MGKVYSRDLLAPIVAARQHAGEVGVFTNGCFDLLHLGHVQYLRRARGLGDFLVVALNSDESTRRLKGPARPLVPERERAEMLAALECVDYVTIFGEDTVEKSLTALRPAYFVKGGDYAGGDGSQDRVLTADDVRSLVDDGNGQSRAISVFAREASIVTGAGGCVAVLSYLPGHSTTELIQRIVAAYGGAGERR